MGFVLGWKVGPNLVEGINTLFIMYLRNCS